MLSRVIMEQDFIRLKEIKPVLADYLQEALKMLETSQVPGDDAVHDVRVLMKKSRAVLKLVARQVDEKFVHTDIIALRDIGRKMCSWRELSVFRKCLKELRKENPAVFSGLEENDMISLLLKKTDFRTTDSENRSPEIEEIRALLKRSGYRIRFLSIKGIAPEILLGELEKTYNKVRERYICARNNPRPEKIHELRKRAKDFLYQLYFFRLLNPGEIKNIEKKLDGITRYLGRYNDLAQLLKALEYEYPEKKAFTALDNLVLKIRDKQDRYLSKAWPEAYRIFNPEQNIINLLGFKLLVI